MRVQNVPYTDSFIFCRIMLSLYLLCRTWTMEQWN